MASDIIQAANDAADVFARVLQWTTQSSIGATISSVGFLLILVGVYYSYICVRPNRGKNVGRALRFSVVFSAAGLILLMSGPIVAAYYKTIGIYDQSNAQITNKRDDDARMEAMRDNKEVKLLVRFIVNGAPPNNNYDLELANIVSLGTANQRYTFVADYDDLKGHTVANAAMLTGVALPRRGRVSAIIFPVEHRKIFPANVKGLLQVVQDIEASTPVEPIFDVSKQIRSSEALDNLQKMDALADWKWENYSSYYTAYCKTVKKLICPWRNPEIAYAVKQKIGNISKDWMPQGYAMKRFDNDQNFCAQEDICRNSSWDQLKVSLRPNFGVRMFLIKNERISELSGRMLIDFDQPEQQLMPLIIKNLE